MPEIIGNTTATPNPQSDWLQSDTTKPDYIKNKPVVMSEDEVIELIEEHAPDQVQADWEQDDDESVDFIKNKPTVLTEDEIVELIEENAHDQLQADWNQDDNESLDFIKNKPTVLTEDEIVELIEENAPDQVQVDWNQADEDSPAFIKNKPLENGSANNAIQQFGNEASGNNSYAGGINTSASGSQAVTIGNNTKATKTNAVAVGYGSEANGENSLAGGNGSIVSASGTGAIAFGKNSTANKPYSVAFGSNAIADGNGSLAFGASNNKEVVDGVEKPTKTSGQNSLAFGRGAQANSQESAAFGLGTIASSDRQFVTGQYNIEDNKNAYANIVGWGYEKADGTIGRANIYTLTRKGEAWFQGDVYVGGSNMNWKAEKLATEKFITDKFDAFHNLAGADKFKEEDLPTDIYYELIDPDWKIILTDKEGNESFVYDFANLQFTTKAEGNTRLGNLYTYLDEWGNRRYTLSQAYTPNIKNGTSAELLDTASDKQGMLYSIKLEAKFRGEGSYTLGNKEFSLLAGQDVVANGDGAAASGRENFVTGANANGFGMKNIVRGNTASAFGYNNTVTGLHAIAFNEGNKVLGYASLAWGDHNNVYGAHSLGGGWSNKTSGQYNFVSGSENMLDGDHIVGFGHRNNYVGSYHLANGNQNVVEGSYDIVDGYNNFSLGNNNTVNGLNNKLGAILYDEDDPEKIIVKMPSSFNTVVGMGNKIVRTSNKGETDEDRNKKQSYGHIINGVDNVIESQPSFRNIVNGSGNKIGSTTNEKGQTISGSGYSIVSGVDNFISSRFGSAIGEGLNVEGHYGTQLVIGKYNDIDKYANFIIGNGKVTTNANGDKEIVRSNSFVIKNDGRAVLGADPVGSMDAATKGYVESVVAEKQDKLEFVSTNLFDASKVEGDALEVYDHGTVTFAASYSDEQTMSSVPFSTMCPDAEVGKTYCFSYETDEYEEYLSIGSICLMKSNGKNLYFDGSFVMSQEILDGYLVFKAAFSEGGGGLYVVTGFYNIALNEGSSPLPYEPYYDRTPKEQFDFFEEKINAFTSIVSEGKKANTIAKRDFSGSLHVSSASYSSHAVNKGQMDSELLKKANSSTVDRIAKRVDNISAATSEDLFIVDDGTDYVKTVPDNIAPYAEIRYIGGFTHNIKNEDPDTSVNYFDINALVGKMYDGGVDVVNGTVKSSVPNSNWSNATLKELFPSLTVGEYYMLSFDKDENGGAIYIGNEAFWESKKFLLTEAMYNGYIGFEGYVDYTVDEYVGMPVQVTFSNIGIYGYKEEVIDTKVTALEFRNASGTLTKTFSIPEDSRRESNYGKTGYGYEWNEKGKVSWKTPSGSTLAFVTFDDNLIEVEPGGTITAVNERGLSTQFTIRYRKKEDVYEALSQKEDRFTATVSSDNLFDEDVDDGILRNIYQTVYTNKTIADFCPELKNGDVCTFSVSFKYDADNKPYFQVGNINIEYSGSKTVVIGQDVLLTDIITCFGGDSTVFAENDDYYIDSVYNQLTIMVNRGAIALPYVPYYTKEVGIKEYIDTCIGNVSSALDRILDLQAYYTGATFDDLHTYATNIKNGGGA